MNSEQQLLAAFKTLDEVTNNISDLLKQVFDEKDKMSLEFINSLFDVSNTFEKNCADLSVCSNTLPKELSEFEGLRNDSLFNEYIKLATKTSSEITEYLKKTSKPGIEPTEEIFDLLKKIENKKVPIVYCSIPTAEDNQEFFIAMVDTALKESANKFAKLFYQMSFKITEFHECDENELICSRCLIDNTMLFLPIPDPKKPGNASMFVEIFQNWIKYCGMIKAITISGAIPPKYFKQPMNAASAVKSGMTSAISKLKQNSQSKKQVSDDSASEDEVIDSQNEVIGSQKGIREYLAELYDQEEGKYGKYWEKGMWIDYVGHKPAVFVANKSFVLENQRECDYDDDCTVPDCPFLHPNGRNNVPKKIKADADFYNWFVTRGFHSCYETVTYADVERAVILKARLMKIGTFHKKSTEQILKEFNEPLDL